MAATVSQVTSPSKSGKDLVHEFGVITFTSTTATVEVSTDLSRIYGARFTRIGDADADDQGILTIDETEASGYVAVSGGAITVDRVAATATGTLTGEKFFYELIGN